MGNKSILQSLFRNKIFKETTWSFLSKAVAFLFFFITNIYLARVLGVDSYGVWSFIYSLLTILMLFTYLGINTSTKKYVAQYNHTSALRQILKDSFKMRLVFSVILVLCVVFLREPIAYLLGRPEVSRYILISAPLIFLSGIADYLKEVFAGLHRLKYNFLVNLIEYCFKFLLILVFFAGTNKLDNIIYAYTLAFLICSLFGLFLLYGILSRIPSAKSPSSFYISIFAYNLPLFITIVGYVFATELDTLMIGMLSTNEQVGIYSVAKQIVSKVPHISIALSMGVMPMFAKLTPKNKQKLKSIFFTLLKVNAVVYVVIIASILFFSSYLIPLIYGDAYVASILPLQILTVYLFSFGLSSVVGSLLDYRGHASKRALFLVFTIVVNVVLNLVLIPRYGAIGASIATSLAFIPYTVLNLFEVRKILLD